MNTTTAAQRIQTISALSLALLISGTTSASHKSDTTGEFHLHEYDSAVRGSPHCTSGHAGGKSMPDLGSRQSARTCLGADRFEMSPPATIRLAKPLSGSQYIRSGDSIRYTF